jgi:phosphatidylglycerol---prolipoprotein diacylglyceryl transferase
MYPILFSIGSFHVYSFSVFLILSWLVFSFLFWKLLRSQAVEEDTIFDLTFYATVAACIGARALFVATHLELFSDTWLKSLALWVQPGLSLMGALVGGVLILISLSRAHKVRLGYVLDAFAIAFPVSLMVGLVGSFLDGSEVGNIVDLPWAVRYVGQVGRRHPIQVYECIVLILLLIAMLYFQKRSAKKKWPYGLVGILFFILYAFVQFMLEFFKDSRVYLQSLSANQWICIAFFAEALGAFYVRGGGRDAVRKAWNRLVGGIYAKFSKRRS